MELFLQLLLAIAITRVSAVCYFPIEYQGVFSTQSSLSGGPTHKYSLITVLPDAIPVWGVCHEMNGANVILHDATGGQECFRCFHISLHSPNIIQVFTEGLDKCYMHEGAARATCPTKTDIKNRIAREIMLYKSRSFSQDGLIDRVFCPFSGQFQFTYDVNDGTENAIECPDSKSSLTNCPQGSELELDFRECRFGDTTMSLKCLGDWTGVDNYQYFALWDTRVSSETQPQYRCGMYHRDQDTGRVFVSFSVDATCTNRLQSPWDGYETMVLTPVKLPSPPAPVHSHSCVFPSWANGKWKDMNILGRELWWKHEKRDKIYQTLCLSQNSPNGERFALYSLNQCGDQEFTCIWMKRRDVNVFEFKMATVQYNYFNSTRICDNDVFIGQEWQTQGRLTKSEETNCPVLGQYAGVIPDAPELCAHLASDCDQPQLMHYTVSSCSNSTEIFEVSSPGKYSGRVRRNVFRVTNPRDLIQRKEKQVERRIMIRQTRHKLFHTRIFPKIEAFDPSKAHFRSIHHSRTDYLNRRRPTFRKRHDRLLSLNIRGSDPTYVFPGPSSATATVRPLSTRLPLLHEKPFYYIVDQYGREVIEKPTSLLVSEREYQCLGQWKEESIMYTFTYRPDVRIYECFAGVVVNSEEAFIVEAGVSCQRGLQPLIKGMKVVKQASCDEVKKETKPTIQIDAPPVLTQPSLLPAWWPSTSRKPWLKKSTTTTQKPLWKNQKPRDAPHSSSAAVVSSTYLFLVLSIFQYLIRR